MFKILVCGGRDFGNLHNVTRENPIYKLKKQEYLFIQSTLEDLAREFSKEYVEDDNWLPTDIKIINGGARGADSASSDWAICIYAQLKEYPADWDKHGRAAGHIRNQQMLDEEHPDLVVAFPGGAGTKNMIERAKKGGYPVRIFEFDESSD